MGGCRNFVVAIAKLAACFSLLLATVTFAFAAERVALVIGNGAYQNAVRLPNPPRDAKSMASLLRALKFEVIEGEDLDKPALEAKLRAFAKAAEAAKVTFVFYAGHGMQVNGSNYLIPVDAKLADASALDFETVKVDRIVHYAQSQTGIAIVLLDACRDNPLSRRFARSFTASRSANVGKGLAAPDVSGGGTIIGFATAPGEEASDGAGDHSPFTAALLKELPEPGVEIQQALTRVKADVYSATKGEQEPWHNSNLRFEFYLNPAPAPSAKGTATPALAPDEALWQKLAVSDDPAAIRLYINAYPSSPHVAAAKVRLAALTKNEKFRTVFAGELKSPESQTYVTFRDTTTTREGPGGKYASRFSIKPEQTVKALGAYLPEDDDSPYLDDAERTWVKVATADGNEGFALGHDLLTQEQFAKRKRLLAQGKLLEGYFDRAKKSWGPLGETAGVWTFGGKCLEPIGTGALQINLGMSLFSRWIHWDEGNTYYRVNVANPDRLFHYALRRRNTVNMRNTGRIQLYEFKYDTGKDLIGYKGDQGFYHKTGTSYGLMHRCGTVQAEEYHVKDLWATWVEAQQRQPDKK